MADQIALLIPETRWNEGSSFTATANFRTRSNGTASTPTTIHYRLDCLTTGTELADWTSVLAASSVAITVTGAHNAIQNDGDEYEVKQLTVILDQGLDTQQTAVVQWRVENLYGSP